MTLQTILGLCLALFLTDAPVSAQWLRHPSAGIPRNADGTPNLSAPAPRTSDGHPDFSGIWTRPMDGHLDNLMMDGVDAPMLPWAEALYRERVENLAKERPSGRCLPHSVVDFDAHFTPRKVIQTPGVIAILFEGYHTFRQIFTDGRSMPGDLEPAWFGYSVGRWEGDTLVVETLGVDDQTWLDDRGHPHSLQMHVTERFRRLDLGHLDLTVTIDDPKTYAKPWTVHVPWDLLPDTELLDWVCQNEKDWPRLVGK